MRMRKIHIFQQAKLQRNGNDFISQTVYEYDPKGNVISETDKGEIKKKKPKQLHPMMITDSQQQSRQQRKELLIL